MGFSEKIKKEVKEKAIFSCCICHNKFIEIHHIIPKSDGGSDEFGNAAPLCSSCHTKYGGNPDLRKTIKQMRDFWFKEVSDGKPSSEIKKISEKIDSLFESFNEFKDDQTKQKASFDELKSEFASFYNHQADKILKSGSFDDLVSVATPTISGIQNVTTLAAQLDFIQCLHCGMEVPKNGNDQCPYCGNILV